MTLTSRLDLKEVRSAANKILGQDMPQVEGKQVVKVNWHKVASPPQTDGSVAFARLRQYAL